MFLIITPHYNGRMGKQLAFMTFGELLEDYGHATIEGFRSRAPGVFDAADGTVGFVGRPARIIEVDAPSWGELVAPQCWGGEVTSRHVATLSMWESIEAVAAFAYNGAHGEAMRRRKDWFVPTNLPEQVAYWLEDGELPSWEQAASRMDHLHKHGPSGYAFLIRSSFDEHGSPYKLDVQKVKLIATSVK